MRRADTEILEPCLRREAAGIAERQAAAARTASATPTAALILREFSIIPLVPVLFGVLIVAGLHDQAAMFNQISLRLMETLGTGLTP